MRRIDSFNSSKIGIIIFQFLIIIYLSTQIYWWWGSINDDAFISFRYAKNFVSGNGLVYNTGELAEGYSNFLWTVFFIPFAYIKVDLFSASKFLSLISLICILIVLRRIKWTENKEVNSILDQLSSLVLFSIPGFLMYSLSGLETAFFSLMILLSFFNMSNLIEKLDTNKKCTHKEFFFAGIMFGLVGLVRADGAVFFLGIMIYFSFLFFQRNSFKYKKLIYMSSSGFLFVQIPYLTFRLFYYGYLLPNSYYAKSLLSLNQLYAGFAYVLEYATEILGTLIVLLVCLAVLTKNKQHENNLFFTGLCVFTIYIIFIGGDWMQFWRFLQPLNPIIVILLLRGFYALLYTIYNSELSVGKKMKEMSLSTTFNKILNIGIACIIFLIAFLPIMYITFNIEINDQFKPRGEEWYHNGALKKIGLWFRKNTPENTVIALNYAGIIPFYAERTAIDLTGLNDVHIGHLGRGLHKNHDSNYVLERTPDYIVLVAKYENLTNKFHPFWEGEVDLYNHPDFQLKYFPRFDLNFGNQNLWIFQRNTSIVFKSYCFNSLHLQ